MLLAVLIKTSGKVVRHSTLKNNVSLKDQEAMRNTVSYLYFLFTVYILIFNLAFFY